MNSTTEAGFLGDLFGLAGKRALITGATSGVGADAARVLGKAGAAMVISGRDAERAEGVASGLREDGIECDIALADLSQPGEATRLANEVLERHGSIDILVNSAGIFLRGEGEATPDDVWRQTMAVNVDATFELCREIGRSMIEAGAGKIVNVASTDGMVGVPDQAAYCASKGAVVQLTRTLGTEWIKHGVNVNAVGPCDVDTPMIAEALGEDEYREWILEAIPAGRVAQPEEISGAILYLASPASDMVVGHILMVDGGRISI
jgi:NAD(P)-dependent dehydrogenase (short-subunit alcohol dehydrogenase family)